MSPILGVILAGGRSRRFGGWNKAFAEVGDRPLLVHVANRAAPQVDRLILCANEDEGRFSDFTGLTVIGDDIEGYPGPLAGLVAAIAWAEQQASQVSWIATFPVDCPFFPRDLVSRLESEAFHLNKPVIAACGERTHPVFGLWPVSIEKALRSYLAEQERRPIVDFVKVQGGTIVNFDPAQPDPFFNINTDTDLLKAQAIAAAVQGDT